MPLPSSHLALTPLCESQPALARTYFLAKARGTINMYGGVRRALGANLARSAAAGGPARQAGSSLTFRRAGLAAEVPASWGSQPVLRPFSVLSNTSTSAASRFMAQLQQKAPQQATLVPSWVAAAQPQRHPIGVAQEAAALAHNPASATLESVRKGGMVFEIGLTFTFMHYQSIFIYFARGLFQAFRPLLILFVFGQILKAVFFVAGAPIWCSFYSIWMFEVIYGLAQCAISFIFIASFYNNLLFARARPTIAQFMRQQRDNLCRLARTIVQ